MMKKFIPISFLFVALLSFDSTVFGQTTGINSPTPNINAALDIQNYNSKNQGVLIPRMPAATKNTFGLGTADKGMIFYGSDTDSIYYWTGNKWVTVQLASTPPSGPWTRSSPNVLLTNASDNVGIGVLPSGTKFEIRGIDATSTNLAFRITNSTTATLMSVSNAGDIVFPTLAGPGVVTANSGGRLSVKQGNAITGVGAAGKVAFWGTPDSLSNNTNFAWDNTNGYLGIGIASPTAPLHVYSATSPILRLTNALTGYSNLTNAGVVELLESPGPFATTGNYGFQMMYDGYDNYFKISSCYDATINPKIYIPRDNNYVGINNTAPAYNLDVTGNARISNLAGPGLVQADASGLLSLATSSRYFSLSGLNLTSATATPTPTKITDFITFTKAAAGTNIEVTMNTNASVGAFPGGTYAVFFELRIDGGTATHGGVAAVKTASSEKFISSFAVFTGLAAGSHTVSVYLYTNVGTVTNNLLDSGGFSGSMVVKETW
jgi:hypothetical protein